MNLRPLKQKQAKKFIESHHRHFKAPIGDIFRIGLDINNELIGCIMAGRPVSRYLDDGYTVEINRCCVLPNYKNACSKLYGAACRAAAALGYKLIITYTLSVESGSSLKAAGFIESHKVKGGNWHSEKRPRNAKTLFQEYDKICWIKNL